MRFSILALLVVLMSQTCLVAEDKPPINVLIITGGCCHDYDQQGRVLAHGLRARANVACTVLQEIDSSVKRKIPLYENPNWSKGWDVVIHDECFSDVKEVEWVEKIVKPHREGLPAVVLHCAMHCYRAPTDDWFKFVGITSPGHGKHYPFDVKNVKPEHPIMKGFGETWQCPKEELYFCDKIWGETTPLAEAMSTDRNAMQTCVWTSKFEKGRVFGTTIGHYTETVASPQYLDLVTKGLLWACEKLDDNGQPIEGYGPKK